MQKTEKKFSENRAAAIAILVLTALLAVPVLGAIRLSIDYGSAAKDFEKIVMTADRHGNNLMSDTNEFINYAVDMLEEGRRVADEAGRNISEHDRLLDAAIKKTQAASDAAARYVAYEELADEAKRFYYPLRDIASDRLNADKSGLDSCESRIARSYAPAYTEFMNARRSMISGFPASLIASIFKIGG